jgi:hypothetical protein
MASWVIKAGIKRKKLAEFYNVDTRVFKNMLANIGIEHSYTLTPLEICAIIRTYGIPDEKCVINIPVQRNSEFV